MISRRLHNPLLRRTIHVAIAAAFLVAIPGAIPGDCPHHQANQDQHDPSHSAKGHAADPGETAPTPCSCMDDCQSSRPIAAPNGVSDRVSFDYVVEIEAIRFTTPVLTLVSYRIPYAHGPPEQL